MTTPTGNDFVYTARAVYIGRMNNFRYIYADWYKDQKITPPDYVERVCRIWAEENAYVALAKSMRDFFNKHYWDGAYFRRHTNC